MAILLGDTGKVSVGTFKEFVIAVKSPIENNVTLDPTNPVFKTNLPLAQDSNVGFTVTLTENMLPTITPSVPAKYTVGIIVGGYNGNVGNAFIYGEGYKNGIRQGTTSQVTATTTSRYWMKTVWKYFDSVPGDILNVQFWASVTDVTFDYYAIVVYPTQIEFTKKGILLTDLTLGDYSAFALTANQTGASLSSPNQQANQIYFSNIISGGSSAGISISSICNDLPYLYRTAVGDISLNGTTSYSHSGFRYYQRLGTWGKVSFRELSR